MLQYHLITLLLLFHQLIVISSISVTRPSFPIELGDEIDLTLSDLRQDTTVRFYIGNTIISTVGYDSGCLKEDDKVCKRDSFNRYRIRYRPTREDYDKIIRVTYLVGHVALMSNIETTYLEDIIKLTSTPTDLQIVFSRPDSRNIISSEPETKFANLEKFEVKCTSSGSLPPTPIMISLSCRPRNQALSEEIRLELLRKNAPLELFMPEYDYTFHTNPEKFSRSVAAYDEIDQMKKFHLVEGNLASSIVFTANKRLDQCKVVCSQERAEVASEDIIVTYDTENAFILPRPENGFIRAGDTVSCHADGNPYPQIRVEGFTPKKSPEKFTKEMSTIIENRNTLIPELGSRGLIIHENGATKLYNETNIKELSKVANYEGNLMYMPIINDMNNDFTIHGSQLTISENATIGTEIIVICYARDREVHSRFIITYRYNASLIVVLGICAGILLLSVVILTLMVVMKKHQKQTQEAFHARSKPGNGYQSEKITAQKASHQPQANHTRKDQGYDYYPVNNSSMPRNLHSPNRRNLDDVRENPYETGHEDSEFSHPVSTFTRNTNQKNDNYRAFSNVKDTINEFDNEEQERHYATLEFPSSPHDQQPMRTVQSQNRTPIHTAGIRSNSLMYGPPVSSSKRRILSRSAGTSSTTLFGTIHNMPPRSIVGGSGGQIVGDGHRKHDSNPDDVDMTEVVAVLRPKESSMNYIEAQKYEAIQSILEMKRKKDSELV